jgi:hypothetical protein
VLAYAGSMLQMAGFALWPVALLHALMAIWCAVSLRASAADASRRSRPVNRPRN